MSEQASCDCSINDLMSPSIKNLVTAINQLHAEVPTAVKDSVGGHHHNTYTTINSILETILPLLSKHGLAVTQLIEPSEYGPLLVTILMHTSGEWIKSRLPMNIPNTIDAQKVGAWITYSRRYSLAAICSIAQEDDDGETTRQAAALTAAQRPKSELKFNKPQAFPKKEK